jgi:hypothetical protein
LVEYMVCQTEKLHSQVVTILKQWKIWKRKVLWLNCFVLGFPLKLGGKI